MKTNLAETEAVKQLKPNRSEPGRPRKGKRHSKKRQLRAVLYGRLLVWATKLAPRIVRLQLHGLEHVRDSIAQGRPIIYAGWHGHNFLTILSYYTEIQKLSRGAIIVPDNLNGRTMEYYGSRANLHVTVVNAALGPSQWARATITLIKLIRSGYCALLSPDGPDGPAYEVKPGIVYIAQQTDALIIPAAAASSRSLTLRRRWDQHLVPLPFSRAAVYFGAPIETKGEDGQPIEAAVLQAKIKQALDQGTLHAERLCAARS